MVSYLRKFVNWTLGDIWGTVDIEIRGDYMKKNNLNTRSAHEWVLFNENQHNSADKRYEGKKAPETVQNAEHGSEKINQRGKRVCLHWRNKWWISVSHILPPYKLNSIANRYIPTQ